MSNISRRTIVSGTAALPALTLPPLAAALAKPADDIFERIAEHRRTVARLEDVVLRQVALEEEIPRERRQNFSIFDRGKSRVGQNDDPRWKAYQAEYWAVSDHKSELAWSFIERPPQTVPGAIALLEYAVEYTEAGNEWPDRRHYFEGGRHVGHDEDVEWEISLMGAVASGLRQALGRHGSAA